MWCRMWIRHIWSRRVIWRVRGGPTMKSLCDNCKLQGPCWKPDIETCAWFIKECDEWGRTYVKCSGYWKRSKMVRVQVLHDRCMGFEYDMAHNGWMLDGDRMKLVYYDTQGTQIGKQDIYPLCRRTIPKGAKYVRVWWMVSPLCYIEMLEMWKR